MGLLAKYLLNNASAPLTDSGSNGYNVAYVEGTHTRVAGHGGASNAAIDIGVASYSVGQASCELLDGMSNLSVSFWFKMKGSDPCGWIFGMREPGSIVWNVEQSGTPGNSPIAVKVANSGGYVVCTSSISIHDTNWHHIMFTFDSSYIKIYIDNVERGSTAQTGPVKEATSGGFYIGRWYDCIGMPPCYIDDLAIYDHIFSSTERSDHYGYGDDFAAAGAALVAALADVVTVTGDLTIGAGSGMLANALCVSSATGAITTAINLDGTFAAVVTATADIAGMPYIAGTLKDRNGTTINCSLYNVRMNVYSINNITGAPIFSSLITTANGTYNLASPSLVSGTKYLVTMEFVGTYSPLGETDIAGADIRQAV